jgi:hypothetical protein
MKESIKNSFLSTTSFRYMCPQVSPQDLACELGRAGSQASQTEGKKKSDL